MQRLLDAFGCMLVSRIRNQNVHASMNSPLETQAIKEMQGGDFVSRDVKSLPRGCKVAVKD